MSSLQIPALYRRRMGSSQNHNGSAGRSLSAYSGASLAQKDYIEARSWQCLWQVFRLDADHKTLIRVSICCVQSSRERLLALRSLQRSISSMTVFLDGMAVSVPRLPQMPTEQLRIHAQETSFQEILAYVWTINKLIGAPNA